MAFIALTKIGTRINAMINGVLKSRVFGNEETAKEIYLEMIELKKNPSDENIQKLMGFFNQKIRIASVLGFELDVDTNEIYLKGFETPVPQLIIDTVKDYIENGYPTEGIVNFWKLLMLNPDKRVRESLFDFINTHNFSITDKGYLIVYKALDYLDKIENDLIAFATNSALHVRKHWKCSPSKYVVYKQWTETVETVWIDEYDEAEDHGLTHDEFEEEFGYEPEYHEGYEEENIVRTFEYKITKASTFEGWDIEEKDVEFVDNLKNIEDRIDQMNDVDTSVFTPIYTRGLDDDDPNKQKIKIGQPVRFERYECDSDPTQECSYGLHVGSDKYVEKFGGRTKPVLTCLVNPMNVIAVPEYDNSKMRVCEYYPFALNSRDENGVIDVIDQKYYEMDYISHEEKALEEMLEKAKQGEKYRPNVDVIEAGDDRTDEEYQKMLQSRLVTLEMINA
jgi:hypothetical protein